MAFIVVRPLASSQSLKLSSNSGVAKFPRFMAISECSDFFDFGASRERIAEFARKPLETASELLDGLKLSALPVVHPLADNTHW